MADVVAARDGGQRLARGAPLQGFPPLVQGQLRLAPEPHPLGLDALPSGAELRPVTNLRIVSGCGVG